MPNAKPEDAQAAWLIFKESSYTATLESINSELARRGFGPIKERTYTHLRKLQRYGYDRYVPTNQLDVETLRDPIWDTPLRSRYLARRARFGVTLLVVVGDELFTLSGEMEDVSELEASASFSGADAASLRGEARRLEHKPGLLNLRGDVRPVVVESILPIGDAKAIVTLRFMAVVPPDRYIRGRSLPTTTLALTLHVEESEYLLNAVRSLNTVVSAVESVRIGCEEVMRHLDRREEFHLTPPEIVSLSQESPIHLVLTIPEKVAALFVWLVGSLTRGKLALERAGVEKAGAQVLNAHAEAIRESTRTRRILNNNLQRAAESDPDTIVAVFVREMQREFGHGGEAEVPTERLAILAEKQIIPSVSQLLNHPIADVEAETDAAVPDDAWPPIDVTTERSGSEVDGPDGDAEQEGRL